MSFDPRKLTPAPWHYGGCKRHADESGLSCSQVRDQRGNVVPKNEVGQFAADARNAFDVMMRRGWTARPNNGKWFVDLWAFEQLMETNTFGDTQAKVIEANDPFTALIEADKWYATNVEKANVPVQ